MLRENKFRAAKDYTKKFRDKLLLHLGNSVIISSTKIKQNDLVLNLLSDLATVIETKENAV